MARDTDWYNRNQSAPWPIDETATLQADDGTLLPFGLIADCTLRFPDAYGDYAYVSSIYRGPGLVSTTIHSDDGTLLATISVPRSSLQAEISYALTPQQDGVGGWIVFGKDMLKNKLTTLQFSAPTQSRLLPKLAKPYRSAPITSIQRLGLPDKLDGEILFTGNDNIEVVPETLTIDGQEQQALVFNLVRKLENNQSLGQVLTDFSGVCGQRPESRNCSNGAPIESINTVSPDCCGTIFLELQGCADINRVQNDTEGVIINCGFPLSSACVSPSKLPDRSGRLPGEGTDKCSIDYLEAQETTTTTTTPAPTTSGWSVTPPSSVAGLPWEESFEDSVLDEMNTVSGTYAIISGGLVDGERTAGELDIVIPDPTNAAHSTIVTERSHGLVSGNRFYLADSTVSGYNTTHTVVSVDTATMLVSNQAWTADAYEGTWVRSGGYANPGGSKFLAISTITKDPLSSYVLLTFIENHSYAVSGKLTVGGSTSGYNGSHTITSVPAANQVVTNKLWVADTTNGYAASAVTGGSGAVASITQDSYAGSTFSKVVFSDPHGLVAGDAFVILGASDVNYNRLHTVGRVVDSVSVVTNRVYSSPQSSCLWYLASQSAVSGYSIFGAVASRNIILWNSGFPTTTDWRCWNISCSTTFSLPDPVPGSRRNAGLVFNYKNDGDMYWLLEARYDTVPSLTLWAVIGGAFSMLSNVPISNYVAGRRYKLQNKILPWSGSESSAYFIGTLTEESGEEIARIGPLRLNNYAAPTGFVGLYCNASPAFFGHLSVDNASF